MQRLCRDQDRHPVACQPAGDQWQSISRHLICCICRVISARCAMLICKIGPRQSGGRVEAVLAPKGSMVAVIAAAAKEPGRPADIRAH